MTVAAVVAFSTYGPAFGAEPVSMGKAAPPRLAVLIVVDQMRADYLSRYSEHLSGGFRRMLDEGLVFERAWVDHAYTNSLPGHTTVITGTYPRRHGVTDNLWYERIDGEWKRRIGFELVDRTPGPPAGLGTTTLLEWFVGSSPAAKVVALGSNEAVLLYRGALDAPAFWYQEDKRGYSGTSSAGTQDPGWVAEFNDRLRASFPRIWTSTVPPALETRLRWDASKFENQGRSTAFPHAVGEGAAASLDRSVSPFVDQATLEFARAAIQEMGLGGDDVPDMLAISLGSLDEVGHAFGPFSHEQTDALLRLDMHLGQFIASLDRLVGRGRWVLALTADHGVTTEPEQRRWLGSMQGKRVARDELAALTTAAYAAAEATTDPLQKRQAAAAAIRQVDFVDQVYTMEEVAAAKPGSSSALGLLALSYVPGRFPVHPFYDPDRPIASLGLFVVLKQDVVVDWATAIHGSTYDEDRRVPMLFLGGDIPAGRRYDRVATVDVAPTLADYIGIPTIGVVDGTVISIDRPESGPDPRLPGPMFDPGGGGAG